MSGFQNNTNQGRVGKVLDTLALIEKSAQSNKAEAAEIASMLAPLVEKLGYMGVTANEAPEAPPAPADADTPPAPRPERRADASKLTVREFIQSRDKNPQAMMDLIYVATAELDTYLYDRGDTRGGKT